jgi:inosine-uridine nucleoside N-ribohydrolase
LNPGEPQKVIVDTDPTIGYTFRDIYDGPTLVMALSDPRLEVPGVTVEFGNTSQHKAYAKAREIVELMGRRDVPVLKGSEFPRAERSEASRFKVKQARRYPGRVEILAVGAPITLVSIELCRQFRLERSRFREATQGADPVDRYLRRASLNWFFVNAGKTVPWDVVGLSFLVHPARFWAWLEESL